MTDQRLLIPKQDFYPLNKTGLLTLSSDVITDNTRLAGIEGDGAAYPDSSVGVWPAATNLVMNGNAATNTTGWSTAPGGTISRSTSEYKFGLTSFRMAPASVNDTVLNTVTITGGTVYTISLWVQTPDASILFFSEEYDVGWGYLTGIYDGAVLTPNTWTRLTMTFTSNASTVNLNFGLTASESTQVFYFGGVQVETGSIATPYIETDGGTASRSAPTISTSFNGVTTSGWVAMRLRAGRASTVVNATDKILFTLKESANVRFEVAEYSGYGDRFYTRAVDAGGTSIVYLDVSSDLAGSFAVGDAQTIVGYWANGGNVGLSYNGSNFLTAANARTISAPTELFIGQWHLGSYNPAVDYKWLAVGKGTLSNTQAAAIHALGNNDPLPHMFPPSAQLSFLAHFNGDGTFYRRSA